MNKILLLGLICVCSASAFQWPGGSMSVPYTFRGEEVFAGWVPSSPWGSAVFLRDPVVELRNASGNVVAEHVATGGLMDWYSGSSRSGTAVFAAAAGEYTVTAREGRRLIRIQGEGYSGFRLSLESVSDPAGSVPPNRAPTIAWSQAPGSVAHGASYTIAAVGWDEDGNLAQVNVWKEGVAFASVDGGDGRSREAGSTTSDAGPRTVRFTARAVDAAGAVSETIARDVIIDAPLPVVHTLTVNAGAGGSVGGGGTFVAGTVVTVTANPDSDHFFAGWSGDASGVGNPVSVTVDRDKSITANFARRMFSLGVSAGAGGSVTGAGSYPAGSVAVIAATPDGMHDFAGWSGDAVGNVNPLAVTIDRDRVVQATFNLKQFSVITRAIGGGAVSAGGIFPMGAIVTLTATADAAHWFSGWSGDAGGTENPLGVRVDRTKYIEANFAPKAGQTITVEPLGTLAPGSSVRIRASASSGLPVSLSVVAGPARLEGDVLSVTGAGTITIEATQAGDGFTLPASPVRTSSVASSPGVMRVQRSARTLLGGKSHFVIGNP